MKADRFILYFVSYQWGATALHKAARYGHTEVAMLLLNRGADINFKMGHVSGIRDSDNFFLE